MAGTCSRLWPPSSSWANAPKTLGYEIPADSLVRLPWSAPVLDGDSLAARVLHVDRFGNVILNAANEPWHKRLLALGPLSVANPKRMALIPAEAYAELAPDRLGLFRGSQGYLELAAGRALRRGPPGRAARRRRGSGRRRRAVQPAIVKLLAPSLAALGFLTRLGPARLLTPQELAASLPWFPVAGLAMGALLAAPFHFGFLKGHALIQAWLLAGINVFLTRGLHWDGWADLWDAWGSGAQGETFWTVLKDSRTGAFGVMGLVLGLGGQILLYAEVAHAHALAVVVWACVLGRTAAVALAWSGKQLARPGLAQAFLCGAHPRPSAGGPASLPCAGGGSVRAGRAGRLRIPGLPRPDRAGPPGPLPSGNERRLSRRGHCLG